MLWLIGGSLVVAALLVLQRLGPVERVWVALAHAISKVTTPILMGIVYFLVVTPIGLVMRLLGRNRSRRHGQRQASRHPPSWTGRCGPI